MRAPALVPAGTTATVATAIGHPSANAMRATPRAFFVNLHLMSRRMLFEVLAVNGEPGNIAAFDVVQCISQSHFPLAMMVTLGFAVGRDVHQLIRLAPVVEGSRQSLCEFFATGQQSLESNRLRYRAVIKEDRNRASGAQLHQIGLLWIDVPAVNISPVALAHF